MTFYPERSAKRTRTAGFFSFLLLGHIILCSVAWVPEYIDRLGITFAVWGIVLGLAPIGAITAIVVTPLLISRFGVTPVIRASSALTGVFLVPLGLVDNVIYWAVLHMVFHFMASLTGVCVNAHAVLVQKRVSQPILTGMHAGWSIGAVGAALSGGLATLAVPLEYYLLFVAFATIVGFEICSRDLLSPAEDGHREEQTPNPLRNFVRIPGRIWLLSFGLLCAVLPEISVLEWSAVLARETGADLFVRPVPFAGFMVGMIIGRLSFARITRSLDGGRVASAGASLAAVSMVVGIFGATVLRDFSAVWATLWMALLWLIAGFGLAPVGPTMMAATSNVSGISTPQAISVLSFVTQTVSILAKVIMGAIAEVSSVSWAFIIPVGSLFVAAWIANQVREERKSSRLEEPSLITAPLPIVVDDSKH